MDLESYTRQKIVKPHYLFRPSQAARRLAQLVMPRPLESSETALLPWGLPITYDPAEFVGSSIHRTGVFELAVTETLFRLAAPGEMALDVGGNIGYMSSVLAAAIGDTGQVIAYEPHPEVVKRLERNARQWPSVTVRNVALSNRNGQGLLQEPEDFSANQGTATVRETGVGIPVNLVKLDDELPNARVGVMKLDAEGSELSVLEGASRLLAGGRIREVVFEEHDRLPTPVSKMLEDAGYTLVRVYQRATRLGVIDDGRVPPAGSGWDAPTYVATIDPDRTLQRLLLRGWRSLRPRSRIHS